MKHEGKRIVVIGAGFAGLSSACVLARQGHEVVLLEKNSTAGGRARVFREGGYTFDMGPSWYWMPEVFDRFFSQFGKTASDFYSLVRPDPAFVIYFEGRCIRIPSSLDAVFELFEKEEQGGAAKLRDFLDEASVKYNIAFSDFIYKPSTSVFEFTSLKFLSFLFKLTLFSSFHSHVRKYFSSPLLLQLLEFPVLFLGGSPRNIPGLYSIMNHAALSLGTWYPMGGFSRVVDAMVLLAMNKGVKFHFSENVRSIQVENGRATSVHTDKRTYHCDAIVNSTDYAHAEQMLAPEFRNYSDKYWSSRTLSPSSLIFYVGVGKKVDALEHHNLFFDSSFEAHARDIYGKPRWPDEPLFYVCCPSRTDVSVAPEGHENLFILMPLAPGLYDGEEIRSQYFEMIFDRIEQRIGEKVRGHIDFVRSYCVSDFERDYNSYKGNAYGLANTLRQTAFLKPSLRNKKVKNLFYAGQLTVPGPGVPPAIISGQIAAQEILKHLIISSYETLIR